MPVKKAYTHKELKFIAHTINVLKNGGHEAAAISFNLHQVKPFRNKRFYVDYNEKEKKFKVYLKYKGFKS